jgi:hypothetical protein
MLSKIWVRDPGSEIRDPGSGKNLFRIPDPGVKKAPDPGSGSATLGRIRMFLGLPDPHMDPLVTSTDPTLDPTPEATPTFYHGQHNARVDLNPIPESI